MSIFSNLFGGNKKSSQPVTPSPSVPADAYSTSRPVIKESDFIDTTDPNGQAENDKPQVVTLNYGTGYPIDAIYSYIMTDWEAQGYNDAIENPDIQNMNTKLDIILNKLRTIIDLTRLKYNRMIRQGEMRKINAEALGLQQVIDAINAELEVYKDHLIKIDEIEKELEAPKTHLKCMLDSYQRGFANGVTKTITIDLKPNK